MITVDIGHLRWFQGKCLSIGKATLLAVVITAVGICTTGCRGGFQGNSTPVWSPDGSKIAFSGGRVRFTAGRDGDIDIWIVNADGSSPTRLTTYWVESRSGWWFTLFLILPSLALILLAVLVWRFVRHRR